MRFIQGSPVLSLASSDRGLLVFLLCDASVHSVSLRYILFFLPIERRPLTRSRDVRKGFRRIHGRRPSYNLHQPSIIQAVSIGVASPQVEPHLLSQPLCRARFRFPEHGFAQYPSRPPPVPFFQPRGNRTNDGRDSARGELRFEGARSFSR